MEICCIALDLDGTTLNRESRLSTPNRLALEYAISKGVQIIVASGRAFFTLPQDVVTMPGISYAVTSNGAAVCRVPSGEVLLQRYLPKQSAERILSVSKAPAVTYEAFVNGIAYADRSYMENPEAYGAKPPSIAYLLATRRPVDGIERFILANQAQLDSVDVICWQPETTEALRRSFRKALPEVYLTSSSAHRLEFSHPLSGKRAGVAWLLAHLGLRPEQLAAFGDGDNDVELLQYAGFGIAVSNATPACRAAADFVTTHHDEDAIAYAIYHILKL